MPIAPTLTDGTVTLRAHREDDVEGVYEQCQDPLSQQWTTVPLPYTREDARRFVTETIPKGWADGTSWGFAVEVDGRYAGTVELRDEGEGRAEVAYGSHPWVRGTGRDGARRTAAASTGASPSAARRAVVWRANKGNWASRKLAWRLGFTRRGHDPQQRSPSAVSCATRGSAPSSPPTTARAAGDLARGTGARGRRAPAARRGASPTSPGSSRRAPTRAPSTGSAGCPCPYTDSRRRSPGWSTSSENRATGTASPGRSSTRADDLALADVSFFDFAPEVELEIGYWAHPDARGAAS